MADKKISELTSIVGADTAADDFFVVVDTSGSATKKISRAELNNAIEQDVLAQVDITSANIDGGTIDNTPIGATTASTGNFTTVDTTGNVTVGGNLTVQGTTVTVDTATVQTVDLGDNDKIRLGNSQNLQLYFDGSNSYVDEQGSGGLNVRGTNLNLTDSAGVRFLRGESGGPTRFYHQGTEVLTSTATGVDVTGQIDVSSAARIDSSGIVKAANGTAAAPTHAFLNDPDNGMFRVTTNTIGFSTAGTERLRISSGGDISFYDSTGVTQGFFWDASTQRLGLGNTAPEANMHISAGDASIAPSPLANTLFIEDSGDSGITIASGTASQGAIRWADSGGNGRASIRYDHNGDYMRVDVNGSERLRITSDGSVGIGVSSPSGKLHLTESGATNQAATIFSLDGYHSTFGANLAKSSGTYTTPAVSLSGGAWEYQPVNSLNNHGAMIYLSAPDTNTSASTPLERLRIDGSGNLLVGKTSANFATAGATLYPSGMTELTRDGDKPLKLNRLTSDGDIAIFAKDGTTVGSIGNSGANLYIEGNTSGKSGLEFEGTAIVPRDSGAVSDAVNNLGSSANRFKDLYLSGGVYLGGTGSANLLDDYEEGTWTPTFEAQTTAFTSVTYDNARYGSYVKVGDLVHIQGILRTDAISGGSGTVLIGGLPFAGTGACSISIAYTNTFAGDHPAGAYVFSGTTTISLRYRTSANGALSTAFDVTDLATGGNSNYIIFAGTYSIT